MDRRNWMYRRLVPGIKGITAEFINGVDEFLAYACRDHIDNVREIRCPCAKCENRKYLNPETVRLHLYRKGFVGGYHTWTAHGELCEYARMTESRSPGFSANTNPLRDIVLDDAGPSFHPETEIPITSDEPPNPEGMTGRTGRGDVGKGTSLGKGTDVAASTTSKGSANKGTSLGNCKYGDMTRMSKSSSKATVLGTRINRFRHLGSSKGNNSPFMDNNTNTSSKSTQMFNTPSTNSESHTPSPSQVPHTQVPCRVDQYNPRPSVTFLPTVAAPIPPSSPHLASSPATEVPSPSEVEAPDNRRIDSDSDEPPAGIVESPDRYAEDGRIIIEMEGAIFKQQTRVTKDIVKIFQEHYDGAWPTWGSIDKTAKDKFWDEFRAKYTWDRCLENKVYRAWWVRNQLRIASKMSNARKTRKRPYWLAEEHWDELWRTVWSTEKYKEICEQASKNRVEGNNGLGPSLNTTGSVSFIETKSREEKKKGKLLSVKDSFLQTHQHQQNTKTSNEWVEKKSVAAKYLELEAEVKQNAIATGTPLPPGWEDVLWLQAVGPCKKGRNYGYDSMVSSGIGTDRISNQSTAIAQDTQFMEKLKNDIRAEVATELREEINELRSSVAEAVVEFREGISELRSSVASIETFLGIDSRVDLGGDEGSDTGHVS